MAGESNLKSLVKPFGCARTYEEKKRWQHASVPPSGHCRFRTSTTRGSPKFLRGQAVPKPNEVSSCLYKKVDKSPHLFSIAKTPSGLPGNWLKEKVTSSA